MKTKIMLCLTTIALFVSGCIVLPSPQSAEEFRLTVPQKYRGFVKEVTVKRSIGKVTSSFKKMAPKCFKKTIVFTEHRTGGSHGYSSSSSRKYTPTVKKNKKITTLTLQSHPKMTAKYIKDSYARGEPKGGYYMLLADAKSAGKGRTKLTIRYKPGFENVAKAVEQWANGKGGCPDLTQ